MGRMPCYSVIFDNLRTISITDLKRWDYLGSSSFKSGDINWRENGEVVSSVGILFFGIDDPKSIVLDYSWQDKKRKYEIKLVSIPSNLGKGAIWYFLCPRTKKKCRKLYLVDGYFLHRTAFEGMYLCQTKSKNSRQLDKVLDTVFRCDDALEELHTKYFKTHYNGKPTKRYLKILGKRKEAEKYWRSSYDYLTKL